MASINIDYLDNEFKDTLENTKKQLDSIKESFRNIVVPSDFEYKAQWEAILTQLDNALTSAENVKGEIEGLVEDWEWAERQGIDLGSSLSLAENTTFYENSAGGGRTGSVGNQYTSVDDEFIVNYIAIYSDGQYVRKYFRQ